MTNILSIDPSLTGTFIFYGTQECYTNYTYFSSNTKDIKNKHCIELDKNMSSVQKLDFIVKNTLNICNKQNIHHVFMEAPSLYSSNTSNEFKYLYGVLEYEFRKHSIKYTLIPPISLKLYFTSNSKAEKKDMILQAKLIHSEIQFEDISKKHTEDLADSLALYLLGCDYILSKRLPAPKGCIDTCDIKYYETLPLHQQQVIAKLYNREDLYNEVIKIRNKIKNK